MHGNGFLQRKWGVIGKFFDGQILTKRFLVFLIPQQATFPYLSSRRVNTHFHTFLKSTRPHSPQRVLSFESVDSNCIYESVLWPKVLGLWGLGFNDRLSTGPKEIGDGLKESTYYQVCTWSRF